MTKHFSLTIAAEEALENVDKRQRSRFVSDAIIAHAKKKDIFSNYNTDKKKTTGLSKPKVVQQTNNSGSSSSTGNNNDDEQEDNQIQFDKDF
jgi:hypothetical protein